MLKKILIGIGIVIVLIVIIKLVIYLNEEKDVPFLKKLKKLKDKCLGMIEK